LPEEEAQIEPGYRIGYWDGRCHIGIRFTKGIRKIQGSNKTEEGQELEHQQGITHICDKSMSNLAAMSEQYRSVSNALYDGPKKLLADIDIDNFIKYRGFRQLGAALPKGQVLVVQVRVSKCVLPFHVAYGKQTRTSRSDWGKDSGYCLKT
jgi:hypothetical protein